MYHVTSAFRHRFIAGLAIALLLDATRPVDAKTVFPLVGGRGDAGFADRCPPDAYLTGLAGRAGTDIDEIEIICSPALPNGVPGTARYGSPHGGSGGADIEFSCPADAFVDGMDAYVDIATTHKIDKIDLQCRSLGTGRESLVRFGQGGEDGDLPNVQICPNGELASGIRGRYGRNVNALGLDCDVRVTAVVSAPASALRCPAGFVWREASPADHVCVTPVVRTLTAAQNAAAADHLSQTNRTYGPNTCADGYVWREAYAGDVVCVTPADRDAAASVDANAPAQVRTR